MKFAAFISPLDAGICIEYEMRIRWKVVVPGICKRVEQAWQYTLIKLFCRLHIFMQCCKSVTAAVESG